MNTIPRVVVVLGAILVACGARGQTEAEPWRFSASLSYYDVPHAQDFWNPIFTADHGRLHLEARHNYVSIDTSSVWAGVNFRAGKKWKLEAAWMFGFVTGSVDGVGTGYELTLIRSWFSMASQGELVYDWWDDQESSLYSWTEFTGSPVDWCRLGFVVQTTHDYGTSDDIQPGVVVAFNYKRYSWEVDVLDPDRDGTQYILSFSVAF